MTMTTTTIKVFAYGTLRTGDCRYGVESFVKTVAAKAYIDGFDMVDLGGYPGLIKIKDTTDRAETKKKKGRMMIRGEVHEYETLNILDDIEDYRVDAPETGLYNRIQVPVFNDQGVIICDDAWVYTFNGRPHHLAHRDTLEDSIFIVESGDWFEHKGYYEKLPDLK